MSIKRMFSTLTYLLSLTLISCQNPKIQQYEKQLAEAKKIVVYLDNQRDSLKRENDSLRISNKTLKEKAEKADVLERILAKDDTTMYRILTERQVYKESTEVYREKFRDVCSLVKILTNSYNSLACLLDSLSFQIKRTNSAADSFVLIIDNTDTTTNTKIRRNE